MHSKKWFLPLVAFLIFILPMGMYFLRDGFLGFDSYYHLDFICHDKEAINYKAWNNPQLAQIIFEVLPCDEHLLKAVIGASFLLSLIILFLTFRLHDKELAPLTMLFIGLTPALLYNSVKIENDIFAYPILFTSMYFFLRYLKNKREEIMDLGVSVLFIFIASLFWGGAIYLLIAYSFAEPILLAITIPLIIWFADPITRTGLPRFDVQENNPINGIKNFIFYMGMLLFGKRGHKPEIPYFPLTFLLTLFGILNPKYFLLAIPFLALTIVNVYKNTSEDNKKMIIMIALSLNLAWALTIGLSNLAPTEQTLEAVQEFNEYSEQNNLAKANDWQYGHLIFFYGGTSRQHSGPSDFNIFEVKDHAVLTQQELVHCELIKEYPSQSILNAIPPLKIYRC